MGEINTPEAQKVLAEYIRNLIRAIKDPDEKIRTNAALALSKIDTHETQRVFEEYIEKLIKALRDKKQDVRAEAAKSIGSIGYKGKVTVTALIEALKDQDRNVSLQAFFALKRIDTPEAQKALEEYKKKHRLRP